MRDREDRDHCRNKTEGKSLHWLIALSVFALQIWEGGPRSAL
jgi:hypothetical protein